MRNEVYFEWINEAILRLFEFQDLRKGSLTEGCFFYPYWRNKQVNYVNSRWQEAVLSLSWFYSKFNSEDVWEKIIKGIDFWGKLQHKNGSFPEYSRKDNSFPATSFSTLSVINSIILLNYSKEKWIEKINKSCEYLINNNELVLINQEAAAALALLKFGNYTKNIRYLRESEKKLKYVLNNQSLSGYYKEQNGFDLGYNTLTLELLGHYYLATNDERVLNSASKFIDLFLKLNLNTIKNSRNTSWIVVGGFEIFSNFTMNGGEALSKAINNFSVQHLECDKNLCTDLYRLCHSYDNCKLEVEHTNLEKGLKTNNKIYDFNKPNKLFNILRPFGIHNFRKYKFFN